MRSLLYDCIGATLANEQWKRYAKRQQSHWAGDSAGPTPILVFVIAWNDCALSADTNFDIHYWGLFSIWDNLETAWTTSLPWHVIHKQTTNSWVVSLQYSPIWRGIKLWKAPWYQTGYQVLCLLFSFSYRLRLSCLAVQIPCPLVTKPVTNRETDKTYEME